MEPSKDVPLFFKSIIHLTWLHIWHTHTLIWLLSVSVYFQSSCDQLSFQESVMRSTSQPVTFYVLISSCDLCPLYILQYLPSLWFCIKLKEIIKDEKGYDITLLLWYYSRFCCL